MLIVGRSDKIATIGQKIEDNRLLARFPRRRLDAEEIRDAMLVTAGSTEPQGRRAERLLCRPTGIWCSLLYDPAQWSVTEDVREHDRRSIYLLAKRNLRLPFGEAFDAPDLQTSCARRETRPHAAPGSRFTQWFDSSFTSPPTSPAG